MNNLFLIISREYSIRVKKIGFVITTLLMPVVMLGLAFAPALIMYFDKTEPTLVNVVDRSGTIGYELLQDGSIPYNIVEDDADTVLADEKYQTVLIIGEDAVKDPSQFTLFTRGSGSMDQEMTLREDLNNAIEAIRLRSYNIDNLQQILSDVKANVTISTRTLDENGNDESTDTMTSFLIGIAMAFILYMFIIIYGQLVMQSIIEEKNNRVLEIIVTSVKPTQLMLGKIIGVGAVAVTQVAIWAVLVGSFVGFGLPMLHIPADLPALSLVGNLSYVISIFVYMLLFLVGGFLLYASIYAAIGASVDNAQDGAQLQTFAMVPVIVGIMFAMTAAQNPGSDIAFWLSVIPVTSPMVMMSRIPSGVPTWEIVVSLLLLYATFAFIVWFAARVYRVGIFMYGKKPTIKELIRWARYR